MFYIILGSKLSLTTATVFGDVRLGVYQFAHLLSILYVSSNVAFIFQDEVRRVAKYHPKLRRLMD